MAWSGRSNVKGTKPPDAADVFACTRRGDSHPVPLDQRLIELIGTVHDVAPDAIVCVDSDLRIVYANEAAARRAGARPEDLIDAACHDVLMGCDEPCSSCRARESFDSGVSLSHSGPNGCGDRGGKVERTWHPIRDEAGDVLCVLEQIHVVEGPSSPPEPPPESTSGHSPYDYIDTTPAILLTLDREGRITLINKTGCELLGVTEEQAIGRQLIGDFVESSERQQCSTHFSTIIEAGAHEVDPCENTIVRPDGTQRVIEWHATALHDDDGTVTGIVASGVDVTRRKTAESELVFHSWVLDQANDSVIVHTPDGSPVYANARASAMCGMKREELLELEPFGWLTADHRSLPEPVRESLDSTGAAIYETLYLTSDGTHIPIEVHATAMSADGRTLIAAAGRDISERKRAEQAMTRLAFYDSLTGLANRALFLDRLRHTSATKARAGEQLAIAFIDLDHFKIINDTLGHRTGDAVLVEVAQRLAGCLREADTLARLGGDEFVVLLEGVQSERDAELVAAKLMEALHAPLRIAGNEINLTASIGVALGSPGDSEDSAALLARADTAMYRAKQSGRATFCLHEATFSEDACERLVLSRDLHHALELSELDVHFQPIIRVEDGLLTGVEAFVRWNHPSLGPVSPATFLPIAEETGLISSVGDWVLEAAVERFAVWRAKGLGPDVRLTVNVSARQLATAGLTDRVASLLSAHIVPGRNLEFEVTEGTVMHETGLARETLASLQRLGVRTSIDDFGSGYSSLEQILALNTDTIKIDQHFVRGLGRNVRATAICRAVISMGDQLGVTVVAEGVETRMQAACLRAEGCPEMQGYLVSPPLPSSAAEALLTRESLIHWRTRTQDAGAARSVR